MIRLRDRVEVLAPGTGAGDDLGNVDEVWDWAAAVWEPAAVQPMGSNEVVVSADTLVTRYRATLLPDTAATSRSRLRWHGDVFEVDGDVALTVDLQARPHHREAILKRVSG